MWPLSLLHIDKTGKLGLQVVDQTSGDLMSATFSSPVSLRFRFSLYRMLPEVAFTWRPWLPCHVTSEPERLTLKEGGGRIHSVEWRDPLWSDSLLWLAHFMKAVVVC